MSPPPEAISGKDLEAEVETCFALGSLWIMHGRMQNFP